MSTFRLGQRVRCVRSWQPMVDGADTWAEIQGKEAVVAGFGVSSHPAHRGQPRIDVSVGGELYWMPPYGLEPILPEGWKPVAWAACLWQPEGVAA